VNERRFVIDERSDADEAVLRANVERLEVTDGADFQQACFRLLGTGRRRLVVDLCGFRSVPSIIIGAVLDTHAQSEGQQVVLAADGDAAGVFRKLFRDLVDIVDMTDGPSGSAVPAWLAEVRSA
jgi:hypothetical protein